MKLFKLATLLLALVATAPALPGCKTVGTPIIEHVDREVDCLQDRLRTQAIGYLDVVSSCLVGLDFKACLAPLSEKAGRDVVACAVGQVGKEAAARAASAGPGELPNQDVMSVHAKEYLDADGARLKLTP